MKAIYVSILVGSFALPVAAQEIELNTQGEITVIPPVHSSGPAVDPDAEKVMNASIFSLLLAATPLPGGMVDIPAFDESVARMSFAAARSISPSAPTLPSTKRADTTRVPPARIDSTSALPLQAPNAALLFNEDTRYALG